MGQGEETKKTIRSGNPAPSASSTDPAPPPRHGCSCFAILSYSLFIAAGFLVAVVFFIAHYQNRKALQRLSPAEQKAYHQWVQTPVDIPREVLKIPNPPSDSEIGKKEKLFLEADQIRRQYWEPIQVASVAPKTSILDLVRAGDPLTSTQLELATTVTATFTPLLAKGRELFARPDYVMNDRRFPSDDIRGYYLNNYLGMCQAYAIVHLYHGTLSEAVDAMDVKLSLLKRDAVASDYLNGIASDAGVSVSSFANLMMKMSSDPAGLGQLLSIMNRHREVVYGSGEPYLFWGDTLFLWAHMQADGYTTLPDTFPETLLSATKMEDGYVEWLADTLPDESNRLKTLRGKSGSGPRLSLFGWNFINEPYVIKRFLNDLAKEKQLIEQWEWSSYSTLEWASSRKEYDQVRLRLARRIAELKNEPIPSTPEDFVPRWMPDYPLDGETSAPLTPPN